MMIGKSKIFQVLNLQERIRKTAEALNKLQNGALVAFTGGAIVVGAVFGGVFWVPAAMSGSLIAYRGCELIYNHKKQKRRRELEYFDEKLKRIEWIDNSSLPEGKKKLLIDTLNKIDDSQYLPPPSDKDENDDNLT